MALSEPIRWMIFSSYLLLAALVFVAMDKTDKARALVNPESHTAASPEDLTVEILDGKTKRQRDHEVITLRAKILNVGRSASGLKPGDLITISYDRDLEKVRYIERWFEKRAGEPGWAGETPQFLPPAPKTGRIFRAYLRLATGGESRSYEPAANQYSFQPLENAPEQ